MTSQPVLSRAILNSLRHSVFALALLCALTIPATQSAQAQTFSVIHTFSNGGDGYQPDAGLTLDSGGNLYGTTSEYSGPGTVFKMKRSSGSWTLTTLFTFDGFDGAIPLGRVVFGPDGALYGTARQFGEGGIGCGLAGCGVVFSLRPPQTFCRAVSCPWTQTVLHNFTGQPDGDQPYYVDPVFDGGGNLYVTTWEGGFYDFGGVFQLAPYNGAWTESAIHSFAGENGEEPLSGVILDHAGNLYGTTAGGSGNVYELSPSGSGWTATTLYDFPHPITDGEVPIGGLVFDQAGNLYGTTSTGGSGSGGTVFELSPSGGGWTFSVLYSFSGAQYGGPEGSLAIDAAGNLYGVTYADGVYGYGSVFKLTPTKGGWTYTDLHDFTGGDDGAYPVGGPTVDAMSDVYGTSTYGGTEAGSCYSSGLAAVRCGRSRRSGDSLGG